MSNPNAALQAIEGRNATAIRSYATGNVESLVSIFAEDAWQFAPNRPALVGRAAIREFWAAAFKWGRWEFTFNTEAVDVCGPLAVERGKYVLRFTAGADAPPGVTSFEDRGNYLVHWRKKGDQPWLVVADAPVSDVPLQVASG